MSVNKQFFFVIAIVMFTMWVNATEQSQINDKPAMQIIAEQQHSGVKVILVKKIAEKTYYLLKIDQKGMSFDQYNYVSSRMDPVLSNDISFITQTSDTLQPSVTLIEKGYEISNSIIYFMSMANEIKPEIKKLVIKNFLQTDDTLTIEIK